MKDLLHSYLKSTALTTARVRPPHRAGLTGGLAVALLAVIFGSADLHSGVAVRRDATVKAVEKALPSVVNIRTQILVEPRGFYSDFLWDYFGPYYRRQPEESNYSLGSGVIIDEDGYVLTNAHVIKGADRIEVVLNDGRTYEARQFAGMYQSDLALLKIDTEQESDKFPAVGFAKPDDLFLGETVIALGNPFGLGSSVSKGILSSKNRRPPRDGENLEIEDWLQTDAAINPGNSGGPLINLDGNMIGLNIAIYRDAEGIGFAVPVKQIAESLSFIFTPEVLNGLWFGAKVSWAGPRLTINEIQPESPAHKAGAEVGDAILLINGEVADNLIDFHRLLVADRRRKSPELTVLRDGRNMKFAVELVPESSFFNARLIEKRIGATLQEINRDLAETFALSSTAGFIISDVEPDGPAADARLRAGYIVLGINGRAVSDVVSAAKIIHGVATGEKIRVDVLIQRQRGRRIFRQSQAFLVRVR